MKFSASFSGGKDSCLAIKRMVDRGHQLVVLIVSSKKEEGVSWIHNLDINYYNMVGQAFGCKVIFTESSIDDYEKKFEKSLLMAKSKGAEACIFGDIDIKEHLLWNKNICRRVGIECIHPLAYEERQSILEEFFMSGLEAVIVKVNTELLDETLIGRILDRDLIEKFKKNNKIDLCGENGEYHTRIEVNSIKRVFGLNKKSNK